MINNGEKTMGGKSEYIKHIHSDIKKERKLMGLSILGTTNLSVFLYMCKFILKRLLSTGMK